MAAPYAAKRQQIEEAVYRQVNEWPEHIRALFLIHLRAAGMTDEKASRAIRKAFG